MDGPGPLTGVNGFGAENFGSSSRFSVRPEARPSTFTSFESSGASGAASFNTFASSQQSPASFVQAAPPQAGGSTFTAFGSSSQPRGQPDRRKENTFTAFGSEPSSGGQNGAAFTTSGSVQQGGQQTFTTFSQVDGVEPSPAFATLVAAGPSLGPGFGNTLETESTFTAFASHPRDGRSSFTTFDQPSSSAPVLAPGLQSGPAAFVSFGSEGLSGGQAVVGGGGTFTGFKSRLQSEQESFRTFSQPGLEGPSSSFVSGPGQQQQTFNSGLETPGPQPFVNFG